MDFATIFQSQRDFFYLHQTKNVTFRKQTLSKLKNILKTNEERLYEAIYKDFRKGRFDTFLTELNLIYNEIDFFLKNLDQLSRPDKVKTALPAAREKPYLLRSIGGNLNYRCLELSLSTDFESHGKRYCSRKYLYDKTKRASGKYNASSGRTYQ